MDSYAIAPTTPLEHRAKGSAILSPSKKRRLRLRTLAEARERERAQEQNEALLQRISKLEQRVKSHASETEAEIKEIAAQASANDSASGAARDAPPL